MQTLEHRVGILEKRVDNHGEEIDDLDDRKGDKVVFNGKTYESLIDFNTHSPSVYPQGWREIRNG